MQLFSLDAIGVSKKLEKTYIDPENMKKMPSKVAYNRPPTFFLCTGLGAQTAQKQKSRTTKNPLMQDWVFRLGFEPYLIRTLFQLCVTARLLFKHIQLFFYHRVSKVKRESFITEFQSYRVTEWAYIKLSKYLGPLHVLQFLAVWS